MKTVKYVPSLCKGENPTFSGDVEIQLPTFDEKYQFLEDCGVEIGESNELAFKDMNKIKTIRLMVKMSEKHYAAVSLKKLSDNSEYKSFSDLSDDGDCSNILIEIATGLLNGFKLGN